MQSVQIKGAKGLFELLVAMGAACLQGDVAEVAKLSCRLGGHVERAWSSDWEMLPELAQGVYELLTYPDANCLKVYEPLPEEYASLEASLTAIDRCCLALVSAKALEWTDMIRILEDHVQAWMRSAKEAEGGKLWMFSARAAERLKFFGDHASVWSVIRPAASYGREIAMELFNTNLLGVAMLWIQGTLHPDDTALLRQLFAEYYTGIGSEVDRASLGVLETLYRTTVFGHLNAPGQPGHRLEVTLLNPELSLRVGTSLEELGEHTLVTALSHPQRGDGFRIEYHRFRQSGQLVLARLERPLNGRPTLSLMPHNAEEISNHYHGDILSEALITLIRRQPTLLETLQDHLFTLRSLVPGGSHANDPRKEQIELAIVRSLARKEVRALITTVANFFDEATHMVDCLNLLLAPSPTTDEDDEDDSQRPPTPKSRALLVILLDLATHGRNFMTAVGDAWCAKHVHGQPIHPWLESRRPSSTM